MYSVSRILRKSVLSVHMVDYACIHKEVQLKLKLQHTGTSPAATEIPPTRRMRYGSVYGEARCLNADTQSCDRKVKFGPRFKNVITQFFYFFKIHI
jgi:hypothetical protein